MEDRQLAGLQLAHKYWLEARNADNTIKRSFARELHSFEMFSLNQLAKIVRLNVKYVAAELKNNATGGRFEPEALTSLISMRSSVLRGVRVAPSLLRLTLENGCSYTCVVTLTGIKYSSYYIDVPKKFKREERENGSTDN